MSDNTLLPNDLDHSPPSGDPAPPVGPAGSPSRGVAAEEVADAVADVLAKTPSEQKKLKKLIALIIVAALPLGGLVYAKVSDYLKTPPSPIPTPALAKEDNLLKAVLDGQREDREANREWRNQMNQDIRELRSDVKDLLRSSARSVATSGDHR